MIDNVVVVNFYLFYSKKKLYFVWIDKTYTYICNILLQIRVFNL